MSDDTVHRKPDGLKTTRIILDDGEPGSGSATGKLAKQAKKPAWEGKTMLEIADMYAIHAIWAAFALVMICLCFRLVAESLDKNSKARQDQIENPETPAAYQIKPAAG